MSRRRPSNSYRVLVCGSHLATRRDLLAALTNAGYQVTTATTLEEFQAAAAGEAPPAVALVDLKDEPLDGYSVIRDIEAQEFETQTIAVSRTHSIFEAIEAEKRGVFWYLSDSVSSEELLFLVARACVVFELASSNRLLLSSMSSSPVPLEYVGQSAQSKELLAKVARLANLETTVLLGGETGTGKTTLARLLHQQGNRREKPFVSVSCASIPRDLLEAELFGFERGAFTGAISSKLGSIELAGNGTLFLDEIGDLPLELQPKLLTFLQERTFKRIGGTRPIQVDVRIIAATHKDLAAMVARREFREDLYFRINVVNLTALPLRQRPEDIVPLAEHHLRKLGQRRKAPPLKLSKSALSALRSYTWPGNIRELENVLERASIFIDGNTISAEDLSLSPHAAESAHPELPPQKPSSVSNEHPYAGKTLAELERQALEQTLAACGGNKSQAAEQLGISLKTIYNKIRFYEIPL